MQGNFSQIIIQERGDIRRYRRQFVAPRAGESGLVVREGDAAAIGRAGARASSTERRAARRSAGERRGNVLRNGESAAAA